MALATQCPACGTVFRISTAQAAAKGGTVRCGQCQHVFDSLDALVRVEDLDPAAVRLEAAMASFSLDGDPQEFDTSFHESTFVEPHGAEVEASSDTEEEVAEESKETSDAVATGADAVEPQPVDPMQGAIFREWWMPTEDHSVSPPLSSDLLAPDRNTSRWPSSKIATGPQAIAPSVLASDLLRTEEAPRARSRTERTVLVVLSAIALLGVIGQAIYLWREELAARLPATRPALVAACALIRCDVGYPMRRDAITIESTALASASPNSNRYVLSALLRNRDATVMRFPHLELTLTDTQDQTVLRRVLRPGDYLPAATARAGFAATSELPVRVTFEVDGMRFVGYRLERFYP